MSLSPHFWKKYLRVYDVLNIVQPYQALLEAIIKKAEPKPGDLVLDAGSGTGNLALKLKAQGVRVIAFDFSPEGLVRHKEKDPAANTVLGDLTQPLPFPDNHFDAVVSNNTIYNISREQRPAVFREFWRVLKPGGRIVIANVRQGWHPWHIYAAHWRHVRKTQGLGAVIIAALRLIGPTIAMFYYNFKILRHHGQVDKFITEAEQYNLLENAGFTNIILTRGLFANQSILHSAIKPN